MSYTSFHAIASTCHVNTAQHSHPYAHFQGSLATHDWLCGTGTVWLKAIHSQETSR